MNAAAGAQAAGVVVDELPDRDAERDLVVAGPLTCPLIETTLEPGERSGPTVANHSAPFVMMCGTYASVSTLLTTVGSP